MLKVSRKLLLLPKALRWLLIGFLLLCIIILGLVIHLFRSGNNLDSKVFYIASGKSRSQIYSQLVKENLISDNFINHALYDLYTTRKSIKSGEYLLPKNASLHTIFTSIVGNNYYLRRFTLPEGFTTEQFVERIQLDPYLTGAVPEATLVEGTLLADTIYYVRGTSRKQIVDKLVKGQAKLLEEIWQNRDTDIPLKNKQELLILASIVEKETGLASEQPRVAAVFLNRLKRGMRLQADSTVSYGLYGGWHATKKLYRRDLAKPTPYNTYIINGLPPAPISNPGRGALYAVAHPAKTDDLYFVAKEGGGHAFANNLADHNVNVRKWYKFKALQSKD